MADVHEPGRATIGRYQLLKKIAAGGMAEIYLARVTGVGGFAKNVVLKRILPQLAESEQFFRMFLDEARIAATLQHPNVVQVYDAGEVDNQYYIAMEYLDGADLGAIRRHLHDKGERLDIDQAVYVISCVCAGLHYAHEKCDLDGRPLGIVHRDVTPHNIFVTKDGGVKLVDFGIAKASNRLARTTYGTMKGKLAYMAPEQCQGEQVDRRSDIYALGIVLYEMTTGTNPHRGGAEYAIMKDIVEGEITPPTQLLQSYPTELEAVVMKAVAKHPDARYQTARELQQALELYLANAQSTVSALKLSDYLVPLMKDIEAAKEARAAQLADEVDAYEDYVNSKQPGKPKKRRRAQQQLAEDAAKASANLDGLLEELRTEEEPEPDIGRSQRSKAVTVPTPMAPAASMDIPAPIGLDRVNVRTGNKLVMAGLGVFLGVAGLLGYLAVTGKLSGKTSSTVDAGASGPTKPALPERGTVVANSTPEGAAVWRFVGRAPIKVSLDTSRSHHLRVEHEGYRGMAITLKPSDWRSEDAGSEASTEVSLVPLDEPGANKAPPLSWDAPEADDADTAKAGKPGTFALTSKPIAAGVWLYVGTTPDVKVVDVPTRVSLELRFQRAGLAPSFVELTEKSYSASGRAEVKPTMAR